MPPNPILEEIYAARSELLAEHQGDVHAYVEDARRRALASGRRIAEPKERGKARASHADEKRERPADRPVTAR